MSFFLTSLDLNKFIGQVKRTATTNEARYATRAVRHTFTRLRRKLTSNLLLKAINEHLPQSDLKAKLLQYLGVNPEVCTHLLSQFFTHFPKGMEVEAQPASNVEPEVDVYLHLLVAVFLLDQKNYKASSELLKNLVNRMGAWNRRTMDSLSGKVYFYFARAHELQGLSAEIRAYVFFFCFKLFEIDPCFF